MKEGAELYRIIADIYEIRKYMPSVSPVSLAEEAMTRISFPRSLHDLGWIGCNLQLRQIARGFCRQKFDPLAPGGDGTDLFPETLQERYPLQHAVGEDPTYVLLNYLPDPDLFWNVDRMTRDIGARIKHRDALRAYGMEKRRVLA
jgi:hypothetical protein